MIFPSKKLSQFLPKGAKEGCRVRGTEECRSGSRAENLKMERHGNNMKHHDSMKVGMEVWKYESWVFIYYFKCFFLIIFHLLSHILLTCKPCKVLILPGQPVAKPLERMASFDWRDETYNPRLAKLLGVAQKTLTTSLLHIISIFWWTLVIKGGKHTLVLIPNFNIFWVLR